jgi:hypothetical protein
VNPNAAVGGRSDSENPAAPQSRARRTGVHDWTREMRPARRTTLQRAAAAIVSS